HLHSLSNLFRRAQAEGRVSLGYNPVSVCEKPSGVRRESHWLEVDEAALLLDAARLHRPSCTWFAVPFAYELVATYPLTGGRTGEEAILQHAPRIVAAVAECIGYTPGEITPYTLRHTYCAARLQTLDAGAPVSPFTVGRELGHGGDALVRKVYGHLGNVRHRSETVEYRVEQHAATLRDRLAALQGQAL